MNKKNVYFITSILLCFIVMLTGCTVKSKTSTAALEKKLIEQKALGISMACYSQSEAYLKSNSEEIVQEDLINTMKSVKDAKITFIKINGYSVNKDNTVDVSIQINDSASSTVIFHKMKFEKENDDWILIDFGVDA